MWYKCKPIKLRKCSNHECPKSKYTFCNIMFMTYQVNTSKNSIKGLQLFRDQCRMWKSICEENYTSTLTTKLSQMHLFIDVLLWEGKNECF